MGHKLHVPGGSREKAEKLTAIHYNFSELNGSLAYHASEKW